MDDPLAKGRPVAALVCRGDQRKYYSFRPARSYGGIAQGPFIHPA
jgi:uncharacterized Fe-S cluster-containing radical SAM superfamily protein